ncbi:MAG: type VI secretion system baseplate subunit TssG [Holosporaceae bacterium]|jgi:predicted component of type VI protein secretion system|nr:type VI secretion system baseplate subunit TssG [Holosporaceae bacterium]
MEPLFGHKKLSLKERLYANAKPYSFEMAAYILETGAPVSFGKEIRLLDAPFRTVSINSFHLRATEIEKLSVADGIATIHVERLSLAGINAPLPTPYADLIFKRTMAKDFAISSFVNMFNMRLLGIAYQISKKNYLCLQRFRDANFNMLVKTIGAFLGNDAQISGPQFSRLSYLFWTKTKSAAGLEAIIRSMFPFAIEVHQFKTYFVKRHNIARMYSCNELQLGISSELGTQIPLSAFRFEIILRSDDYKNVVKFSTSKKHISDLKLMIEKYLGEFFRYTIKIIPQTVPPLRLGYFDSFDKKSTKNHQESSELVECLLGKTSWISVSSTNGCDNTIEFDAATITA